MSKLLKANKRSRRWARKLRMRRRSLEKLRDRGETLSWSILMQWLSRLKGFTRSSLRRRGRRLQGARLSLFLTGTSHMRLMTSKRVLMRSQRMLGSTLKISFMILNRQISSLTTTSIRGLEERRLSLGSHWFSPSPKRKSPKPLHFCFLTRWMPIWTKTTSLSS